RMEILHGLNPYTTIPALGPPSDPTFLLSNWHQLLSPYGPLFTIFSFALVPLGVAAGFWVLKASLMIAGLATLWLVWRCAVLVAAVAIKASAGILLPVVLLGAGRRLRLLGGMIAGAVVFGGASLYAFGPHLPNLAQQSTLVTLAGLPNVVGSILGLGGETDS